MARGSRTSAVLCLALGVLAWSSAFVGSYSKGAALRSGVPRRSFQSGKVNKGVEPVEGADAVPKPIIDCDEACMIAISECISDGCSVEAMMALDQQLAHDEAKVMEVMVELKKKQKTEFSAEDEGNLAWFSNFLGRTGTLRAQLHAVKEFDDGDFLKKFIKAASFAFGGARHGDYPKSGVSPYTM